MVKNASKTQIQENKWAQNTCTENNSLKHLSKNLQYCRDLIENCSKTSKMSENDDENICKLLIAGLNKDEIDHDLDLKIIACIASHFADQREGFVERGAFLATAFFKKDEFEAQKKKSYKNFEDMLSSICIGQKQTKDEGPLKDFKKVYNNQNRYFDYDCLSGGDAVIYDEYSNPVFLQKAIKILQTSEHTHQIKAVHYHFKNILGRADSRTLKIYSNILFEQLLDLSNNKVYEEQFKSLAYFLSTDFSYYVRAIKLFKDTKLDTLRVYLLYAFDLMEELVEFSVKVKIHLLFAEMLLDLDLQDNQLIKNSIVAFVEKGMRLVKNVNEDHTD